MTLLRRCRMTRSFTRIVIVTLLAPIGAANALAQSPDWSCPVPTIEPCLTRHGRLSTQNGISMTIWLIGTTRRVAVANQQPLYAVIPEQYLSMTSPDHSYIFGDFEICPTEPDKPGHMRHACVTGAEKFVVQPHDTDRARRRPAFRLTSSWPRG